MDHLDIKKFCIKILEKDIWKIFIHVLSICMNLWNTTYRPVTCKEFNTWEEIFQREQKTEEQTGRDLKHNFCVKQQDLWDEV